MKSRPQIYILSAPSGAGKTTSLIHYVDILRRDNKCVGGVLQIVKNKRRYIRFLSNDSVKLLQVNDVNVHNIHHDPHYIKHHGHSDNHHCKHHHNADTKNPDNYDEQQYIKCGRFLCSKAVLSECQTELNNAHKYDFVMIDEVGNWEMTKKKGYEPALSNILKQRNNQFKNCKFVIVVRPSLKQKLIKYFDLKPHEYADFEDLYEWQLSLKLSKQMVFASFITCFVWTVSRQIIRYKKR